MSEEELILLMNEKYDSKIATVILKERCLRRATPTQLFCFHRLINCIVIILIFTQLKMLGSSSIFQAFWFGKIAN
ncbi:hypothetical protein NIES25_66370 (plasmid) [Nostoc linckia NIES-25]|nr:hypothetical protein NIES25_66370 [Nostoc linckia NIES-25]